jgi:hypothetical protein
MSGANINEAANAVRDNPSFNRSRPLRTESPRRLFDFSEPRPDRDEKADPLGVRYCAIIPGSFDFV